MTVEVTTIITRVAMEFKGNGETEIRMSSGFLSKMTRGFSSAGEQSEVVRGGRGGKRVISCG